MFNLHEEILMNKENSWDTWEKYKAGLPPRHPKGKVSRSSYARQFFADITDFDAIFDVVTMVGNRRDVLFMVEARRRCLSIALSEKNGWHLVALLERTDRPFRAHETELMATLKELLPEQIHLLTKDMTRSALVAAVKVAIPLYSNLTGQEIPHFKSQQ